MNPAVSGWTWMELRQRVENTIVAMWKRFGDRADRKVEVVGTSAERTMSSASGHRMGEDMFG